MRAPRQISEREILRPICVSAVAMALLLVSASGNLACGTGGGTVGAGFDAAADGGIETDSQPGGRDANGDDQSDTEGAGAICPLAGTIAPSSVLADRLARFLWNQKTATDDLLQQVAVAPPGHLRDVAKWMLTDPRAREGVAAFTRSWLRLTELGSVEKPQGVLTADLIASMQNEAPSFAASVILDGDAKYQTLMLAPYTFIDETLAAHYGIDGVSGPQMRKVPYDVADRAGILGGAGVQTRFSGSLNPPWPPRRFWLIYETMLCDAAALPPAIPQSNRFDPTVTIQQDLETHTSGPPCNACHVTVNPVGSAFSKFDTFGRYRSLDENGAPINTTEVIPAGLTVKSALTVAGAADLIHQLTERSEVRRCFSARWLDYALNPEPRSPGSAVDALPSDLQCDLTQVNSSFEASGGDIRELVLAIVETSAFLKSP